MLALTPQVLCSVAAEERSSDAPCPLPTFTCLLQDMRAAVAEERYSDAATLRDAGGAGLLGWWVGRGSGAGDEQDFQGHLLRVAPDFGRYVGQAYTAQDIVRLQVSSWWVGAGLKWVLLACCCMCESYLHWCSSDLAGFCRRVFCAGRLVCAPCPTGR